MYFPKKNMAIMSMMLHAQIMYCVQRTPCFTRSILPAPRFCPTYVAMVAPNATNTVINIFCSFPAAENPAMQFSP